jgi:2-polyprenyl-3-methyl-5-hydroxy-6-metoxy-1,4-benzoquinol methylase
MMRSLRLGLHQADRHLKIIRFAVFNKINAVLNTGNMRFAFERMYLTNHDPWNYRCSTYERAKYKRTLECVLTWRRASGSALEVGCSIGIFSGMIAEHFDKIMAIDVSKEALCLANKHNHGRNNITFANHDLRTLELGEQYDIIVCAEVLYYIRARSADMVCRRLARHLAQDGVIIFVAGTAGHNPIPFCWPAIVANFREEYREIVDHPIRPFEIGVFSKNADRI